MLEKLTNGNANLRIISNLADRRIRDGYWTLSKEDLGGEEVVDGIVQHTLSLLQIPIVRNSNKGVMNGVNGSLPCNRKRH